MDFELYKTKYGKVAWALKSPLVNATHSPFISLSKYCFPHARYLLVSDLVILYLSFSPYTYAKHDGGTMQFAFERSDCGMTSHETIQAVDFVWEKWVVL